MNRGTGAGTVLALLGVATLAASVAACSSSSPPDPATVATSACQTLATATSTVNLLNPSGLVPGQPLNLNTWAAMLVNVEDEQASLPQPLRSDLQPLLDSGANGVTQTEVAQVSADCAVYGVAAAIWPQFMTSAG
jgi:hypothetical protein